MPLTVYIFRIKCTEWIRVMVKFSKLLSYIRRYTVGHICGQARYIGG
jgi:hypothetical protein